MYTIRAHEQFAQHSALRQMACSFSSSLHIIAERQEKELYSHLNLSHPGITSLPANRLPVEIGMHVTIRRTRGILHRRIGHPCAAVFPLLDHPVLPDSHTESIPKETSQSSTQWDTNLVSNKGSVFQQPFRTGERVCTSYQQMRRLLDMGPQA